MNRPSHKELFKKLGEAKKAVNKGKIMLLNQLPIAADAIQLGYAIELDLEDVLAELLEIIHPEHYAGSRPPQRSYEQDLQGLELFAFSIHSQRFKCRLYLKFALVKNVFWLVSLHPDRSMKEAP